MRFSSKLCRRSICFGFLKDSFSNVRRGVVGGFVCCSSASVASSKRIKSSFSITTSVGDFGFFDGFFSGSADILVVGGFDAGFDAGFDTGGFGAGGFGGNEVAAVDFFGVTGEVGISS